MAVRCLTLQSQTSPGYTECAAADPCLLTYVSVSLTATVMIGHCYLPARLLLWSEPHSVVSPIKAVNCNMGWGA